MTIDIRPDVLRARIERNALADRGDHEDLAPHCLALLEEVDQLRADLGEALDIAEWEASEIRGKLEHLTRIAELRKRAAR